MKQEPADHSLNRELFPDAQVDNSPRFPPETIDETQAGQTDSIEESDTVPADLPPAPSDEESTEKDKVLSGECGTPNVPEQPEQPEPSAPPSQPGVPAGDLGKGSSIGKGRGGVKRRELEDSEFSVASTPPPVLSEKAIDSRLRRVFTPRADGSRLLDDSWLHQWQDKGEGRSKVLEIFEKVGYNVDMGCQKRGPG